MQAAVSIVLLITLLGKAQTSSQHLRTARQATRSCDPGTETCSLLTSCPQLQKLLRPPTAASITLIKTARCGSQNHRAKFCCPTGENPPTAKPAVPTIPKTSSGEALLPSSCGLPLPGDKIHGGTPADLGAYPWMAVLGFQSGEAITVEWACGGSLINNRYVLTAAHCTDIAVSNRTLSVIRLGENNLETDIDCRGTGRNRICSPAVQDFSPEEVILHPDYRKRGFQSDDLAIIRLDRPVEFSTFIQPICLPEPGDTLDSLVGQKKNVVIGFGDTEFGQRSLQLLQVFLPVVPKEQCRSVANYDTILAKGEGQVCLGGQFQQDSCFKDSGGPAMVTRHENGPPYVQVAIVSYGNEICGLRAVPAIYTNVPFYRRWIVDNLRP